MRTVKELREQAEKYDKVDDFSSALKFYKEIWEIDKSEKSAYDYVKCMRKSDKFSDARALHESLQNQFNTYRLKNEVLWLDYSEKIRNWDNDQIVSDAELLLSRTDQNDRYKGKIYQKTVLTMVKYYNAHQKYAEAKKWLDKLDFNLLGNDIFKLRGKKYPSDLKVYFIQYADILIKMTKHIEFIENCLSVLNFSGIKLVQFQKAILERITFDDYISRVVFALYIKYFKEESYLKEKKRYNVIFNKNKMPLISDLSDFEFCPVSYAINETYSIPSNSTWERDEWLNEKLHLHDRIKIFNNEKNLSKTFEDTSIVIDERVKKDFSEIFNSNLLINNSDGKKTEFFTNPTKTIRGAPEYVFIKRDGLKFAVVEKFTRRTSENISEAFLNDRVKLIGYLYELTSLNLAYGYLVYWYWQYDTINNPGETTRKKIKIRAYRIFRIEKTKENKGILEKSLERLQSFRQTKQKKVDGAKISVANKCLNCSVIIYCNHKTGEFNDIYLPYNG